MTKDQQIEALLKAVELINELAVSGPKSGAYLAIIHDNVASVHNALRAEHLGIPDPAEDLNGIV